METMAKMQKCTSCGNDVASTAKACPSCGAKVKKPIFKKWWFWVIAVIIIIGIIGGSSGGSDEPNKVGESTPLPSGVETSKESEKSEFGVGDIVELKNVSVTMTKVYETSGSQFLAPTEGNTFIVCEFEIANNSGKDIVVSSLMSFEAYVDDYSTSMSISAMTSVDTPQLDGTVAAGKRMHGVIGYEAPADWSNIEVRFTPDFWSGKDIIFTHQK